ncbi:MAG: tetratricopeptide repeat protein [Flavobacteriales bacterium]|nr:tetratricopeptide repeat protein [Flavobacteriales bacterium]MCB9197966.1 tetratricopeptide repeat protein [Flavobacteriales bacterium]
MTWSVCGQVSSKVKQACDLDYNDIIGDLKGNELLLLEAAIIAADESDEVSLTLIHEKLALVYYYLKDVEKGIGYSLKAITYYEKQGDIRKVANIYADLGFAIKEVQLDRSLEYFRMVIKLSESNDFGGDNAKFFNNYGTLLSMANQQDSALYYHLKSLQVCRDYNDSLGMPYSLNNAAVVYSQLGQFDKAFELLDESDLIRKLEKNDLSWADNLAYRADLYYEMQNYDSAVKYYQQALELSEKAKFVNLISFSLLRLSESYEKKNDAVKSLFYFKKLQSHKDSVINLETNKAIAGLQEEFNAAVKEKTIAEQNLKIQKQNERILYIVIGLFIFILIVFGIVRFQIRKRREERLKFELNQEQEKAKAEKKLYEEKLRIGRELHDNIGAQLTFMISSVDNLNYIEQEEGKKIKLSKIGDFGRSTMKELRTTIWAMKQNNGTLDDLIIKINELKLNLQDSIKIEVHNKMNKDFGFNAITLLNLYRVIQESVQNTIKYAEASLVVIIFDQLGGDVVMTITDNGKGFDVEASRYSGNGLSNMKRRCGECGGELSIESGIKGTKIRCVLKNT